nr:protease Do-like 9 [Ziziphus jujuba var. spinosa]
MDERSYLYVESYNGSADKGKTQPAGYKFGMQRKDKKEMQYDLKDLQVELGNLQDAAFLNAVVKVYCTHTAPDYSLPWQKQRQYTSTGSAFMIGDGKQLTNAHCVEHDTQVTSYAHGSSDLLGIEIDGTINPEKENLYLYGLPNETWEVNLPIEEIPPELPEPALGINHVRDGMQKMDWLSLVVDAIVQ